MKKFKTASGEPPVLHRNSANLMQSMLDEVKANITVLPELKSLIPPLQPTEFEQLEANIMRDGCREALLIWQTTQGVLDGSADSTPLNVLIDGHNRYVICTKHGIDFKVALREFPTLQAVRDFMIDNQLGRRNLTPEQMSYLRGLKYRNERQATGRPTDTNDGTETVGEKQAQRTRDKLAKEFNVSPSTILRDRDYSEGLDRLEPELKQEVLKGTRKLPKEVVRELGRQGGGGDAAPLTLADVNALSEPSTAPAQETPKRSRSGQTSAAHPSAGVKSLIVQISQLANTLDPTSGTFEADCDKLMALLKEAKKQVK